MAKKKQESPGAPAWMTTYGDLVTNLLCFFVMLYAMSNLDVAKFNTMAAGFQSAFNIAPSITATMGSGINSYLGAGITQMPILTMSSQEAKEKHEKGQQELNKMASDFETYFAENNLDDSVQVEFEGTYVLINFNDGILFDKGKADLKPGALDVMDMVADEIMKYPGVEIKIEGHTDSDPISTARFTDNIDLSQARAASVFRFFMKEKGFDPAMMEAVGLGEFRPIAPNDNEENKTKNRRVEIKIMSSVYSDYIRITE